MSDLVSRACTLSYPCHGVSLSPSALTELSECDSIENVPHFQTLQCSSTSVTAGDLLTKALALHSHQDCSCCPRLPEGCAKAGYSGPRQEPRGSVASLLGGIWRAETLIKTLYISLQLAFSHSFSHLLTDSVVYAHSFTYSLSQPNPQ